MNQKILIVAGIIIAVIAGISYYFTNIENNEEKTPITESANDRKLVKIDTPSLFVLYGYENDYEMVDGVKIWRNAKYELNPEFTELYKQIGITYEPKSTVVVYPVFTAAAYSEPGFYTYYRGECDLDCLTVELRDEYDLTYQASGNAVQVFSLLGYPIITDIAVDNDPNILSKYDKVILLHNEYVTRNEFDAITKHPKVIYLYPNALYAEITVDYDKNSITLVRGHGYPATDISNGFDWVYDNSKYEYNLKCQEIIFHRINNGWMSDCYPENLIHRSKELLKQIKDF
ncbi:MAG: hypothetical protein FJ356_05510 [Thaumarchaeota archaeon]|nr:hypothetical protein [Nitrososphaerota archaeon]